MAACRCGVPRSDKMIWRVSIIASNKKYGWPAGVRKHARHRFVVAEGWFMRMHVILLEAELFPTNVILSRTLRIPAGFHRVRVKGLAFETFAIP